MNDANSERESLAAVDHALHTLPVAVPPAALSKAIMARVRAESQPRFRLRWFDYLVSAFGATAAGVMLLLLQSAPPQVVSGSGVQSTLIVNQVVFNVLNLLATGCWYCAH